MVWGRVSASCATLILLAGRECIAENAPWMPPTLQAHRTKQLQADAASSSYDPNSRFATYMQQQSGGKIEMPWESLYRQGRLADGSKILMTPPEQALLERTLATAQHYFEFGAGGSTRKAVEQKVPCITSVDSSADWIQSVQKAVGPRPCFEMHVVDMGPTQTYNGMPRGETSRFLWSNYPQAFHQHGKGADTVLVDGRFRAACAIAVWLDATPETRVMVHDYYRQNYHVVEVLYDVVEQAESLVLLQPNARKLSSDVWRRKANDLFAFYQYELA